MARRAEKNSVSLMDKAVSSKNLIGRSGSNVQYAKNDFSGWVKSLLSKLNFSSVLDVCCGTGNQLVIFAGKPNVTSIVGIDASDEALAIAKDRLDKVQSDKRVILKNIKMEEMFLCPELKDSRFDLISCFYGLYYSKKPLRTLDEMIRHLSDNGALVIAGPYGKNNASLFNLLKRHFTLPELVLRSSSTFMEKEVLPVLKKKCDIEEKSFVNPISYPDAQSLITYWKSSTFYFPEYEEAVARDVEIFFSQHKDFVIEKHVKAYIGRKI